jgi:hypothetical protein
MLCGGCDFGTGKKHLTVLQSSGLQIEYFPPVGRHLLFENIHRSGTSGKEGVERVAGGAYPSWRCHTRKLVSQRQPHASQWRIYGVQWQIYHPVFLFVIGE